jgi:TetR/AcrR family transcriptional repressor of nem operon
MSRPSLRENILDAGLQVMLRHGYNGAGVRDVCAAANAPQGSFTNHFRSKEAFALEVLERYFAYVRTLVAEALEGSKRSPRQRLKRYLEIITGKLATDGFVRGCLVGDLSLEAAPHSEVLRQRLHGIFAEWCAPFAACIAEAQAAGEIDTMFSAEDLAEFLLASWHGAILRMKVEQSAVPLQRFKKIAFATVFKEPT